MLLSVPKTSLNAVHLFGIVHQTFTCEECGCEAGARVSQTIICLECTGGSSMSCIKLLSSMHEHSDELWELYSTSIFCA